MRLVANSILVTLILSVMVVTFSNFIMFFPWYMTMVYETYNLSVQASAENYVSSQMVRDVRDDLSQRPIYKRMGANDIKVLMNSGTVSESSEASYKQRGEQFTVGLECTFPFELNISGTNFRREINIRFDIPVTGLKYYKELPS